MRHAADLVRICQTRYLESKNFDDPHLELEGVSIDELGLDAILYFPAIRSYQPPQP